VYLFGFTLFFSIKVFVSFPSQGLYKILIGYEDKSATVSHRRLFLIYIAIYHLFSPRRLFFRWCSSQAVCTLAFCPYPHADPIVFTGRCTGTIVQPTEGGGFGWDSIFVPDGQTEPFSRMETEKKCELSHRSKAVLKWADWLGKNIDELYERQYGRPAIGHKGLDFKPSSYEQ
jgi:hypothetical protein